MGRLNRGSESGMNNDLKLWKKKFFIIWTGQGISSLTSSIVQMAIIWYITNETHSAAALSFATLLGFLPQAVLGMFIGVFIDRYDKKKIMIYSDLCMSLLCVVLVISGMTGRIPMWLIFISLFLRSVGNAFYSPSLQATTPSIVPKGQLTKYAGYAQTFNSAATIASPALAAVLYTIFPLSSILMLDIIGAVLATITLAVVKIPKPMPEKDIKLNVFKETKEGYEAIRKVPGMRELLIIGALYAMIYFPIGTLYPLITMTYFNGSVGESGIVEMIFSAGTLTGSLLLGAGGEKIDKMKAVTGAIALYGLGTMITGLLSPESFLVFVVLSFFMGISVPFYFGVQTSIFQIKIDSKYLGRALSLMNSISMIAMPLGLVLSGMFAGTLGVEKWFLMSGIATLGIAILTMAMPALRHCSK